MSMVQDDVARGASPSVAGTPGDDTGRPAAASRPARFDAQARSHARRWLMRALVGAAGMLSVAFVGGLAEGTHAWHSPVWRLWLLLFPLFCLWLPPARSPEFQNPRLARTLRGLRLALQAAAVVMALQALCWLAGLPPLPWPLWAVIAVVHTPLALLLQELARRQVLAPDAPLNLVVVGAGDQGRAVARHLMDRHPEVKIAGFCDDRQSRLNLDDLPAPWCGRPQDLLKSPQGIDGVVIALPHQAGERVRLLAEQWRRHVPRIYLAPESPVMAHELAGQSANAPALLVALALDPLPLEARLLKRAFDIVVASIALLMFAPAWLLIATLVRLESPGPVIFRQKRYGLGNRLFEVWKFRSMRFDREANRGPIELTQRGDARVTRIGDVLRRTSLDEFPQFVNVLLGDMSVVGPRPHPPGVKAGQRIYEEVVRDFPERYKVRPGITGWAQVNGLRGNTFTEEHLIERYEHDLQYIRHWSLELDVWIVLRTIGGGFGGRNAF